MIWHLFAVGYFVFVMVFVIWHIFYLAFVWQMRLISIAVSFSTVVAFKPRHEMNSTKASLNRSSPGLANYPSQFTVNNASAPEYIRDLL